ncbi:MAG: SAM-dependent methyltransferase [Chloroflexota bacterium]|nr:SAM-dependent methyltransferase [Chloroflexota bacterium]
MSPPIEDDFAPITESGPLADELRARIAAGGPMTFRDFMEAALYHPRFGYYTTHADAMTRGGDYVTSPEVHAVFGTLVAKQLIELWELMGRPARFDLVEAGGGGGLLARDILLRAARAPAFAAALRYRIVERSPALAARQRQTLAGVEGAADVGWLDALPDAVEGCVLSNEFFDALPVHRVRREGGDLREVYVTHDGRRFADAPGPLSTPALASYFEALGLLPGEGCLAEVNLDAVDWMKRISRAVTRGAVLTFDYGYEAGDLYAPWRRDGTLLCFYRQSASSDPYQRLGRQDITASVDFTSLRAAGERAGLRTLGMTDQAQFLLRMGIGDGLASVARERPEQIEEYFARRNVVMDLIDPGRLGRIKVLLQGRGLPDGPPRGFREGA